MISQLVSLLALLSLLQVASSRTIEIDWFIPQNQDGYYADKQASPGDVIVFNYEPTGQIDVYIHPSGECDREGSILIAEKGAGTGNYTFVTSEINTTIFFTSQAPSHCTLGQFINVNVVEAPDTQAPSFSPSMVMSEIPSDAPSTVPSTSPSTPMPTSAPTTSPTIGPSSIFVLAAEKGTYNTLLSAANSTGILGTLQQLQALGPLTVFGPTDDAFSGVPLANLTQEALIGILSGHVVRGNLTAADFIAAGCTELDTVSGTKLSVTAGDDGVVINGGPSVVDPNILADDGVLHGIDGIILGDDFVACPTPMPSSSFIPSDMPSLVPSDMPSIVPSAMAVVPEPPTTPTRPPTVAPQAPAPPTFDFGTESSRASSLGVLAATALTVAAAAAMMV